MENKKLENNEDYLKPNYITCKKTVVLDCDEILCNISPKWVRLVYEESETFNKYFKLKDSFNFYGKDYYDVLNREEYLIQNYLKYHDEIQESDKPEIEKKLYDLYRRPDFYVDLFPTNYGSAMSKGAIHTMIDKVYVISKVLDDSNYRGKEAFIKKLFKASSSKLEIIKVGMNEKKSDYIKQLGDEICLYAEDDMNNIIDVFEECDNMNEMFLQIPKLGYNLPTDRLVQLSEYRNLKVTYFDPIQAQVNENI